MSFEYVNHDSVDEELKCTICFRPYDSPVSNNQCGHTFCLKCVQNWHENSLICPTCRQPARSGDYQFVRSRAILNQLYRLNLKCNLCEQMNITDGQKHLQICPKQIIKCKSADIQCQWEGEREKLQTHLETCPFQQIRPIIGRLTEDIRTLKQNQNEQNRFIEAFINDGQPLSHLCAMSHCFVNGPMSANRPRTMSCSLCNKQINPPQIALHSCITINCICKLCLTKYTNQQSKSTQTNLKRKFSFLEELHFSDHDD